MSWSKLKAHIAESPGGGVMGELVAEAVEVLDQQVSAGGAPPLIYTATHDRPYVAKLVVKDGDLQLRMQTQGHGTRIYQAP